MFSIKEINSKTEWDQFLDTEKPHTFLHSWSWGEFQKISEGTIWRVGAYQEERLCAVMLVILVRARRGIFLFCPHGPIISEHIQDKKKVLKSLAGFLRGLGKKERASFIRVCPLLADTDANKIIFSELGFRRAPIHMHPERAWILDITKTEEEILKSMRKQTRHCIRNAATMGVTVEKSENISDLGPFYSIYEATVARQDFVPFSLEYLKKEFSQFSKDGQASIFLGRYNGKVISGAIILFANGSAFYHHGASNPEFSKIPAAHLLQWEIIRDAKRRGLLWYNFWGIAPENMSAHPWAGLSLFKKGFGGFSEEYIPAQDSILNSRYWITYTIERIRKWRRGL